MSAHWRDLRKWLDQALQIFSNGEVFLAQDPSYRGNIVREKLPELTAYITDKLETLPGKGDADIASELAIDSIEKNLDLAVLLVALGPADWEDEDVPQDIWQTLLLKVKSYQNELDFEFDLVVAFGCGWGRTLAPYSFGWGGLWDGAYFVLADLVRSSIRTANRLLKNYQIEMTSWPAEEDILNFCNEIAIEILRDECRCANLRKALNDTDEDKSCPEICHNAKHSLKNWEPNNPKLKLRAFISEAVRGSGKKKNKAEVILDNTEDLGKELAMGAFSTSVFYPRIALLAEMRISTVEFKVCHNCNLEHLAIQHSIKMGGEVEIENLQSLYEGSSCPHCGIHEDPYKTYYKGRKNWLINIGEGNLIRYEYLPRYHCNRCGNYYPVPEELYKVIMLLRQSDSIINRNKGLGSEYNLKDLRQGKRALLDKKKELEEKTVCPLCHRDPPQLLSHLWKLQLNLLKPSDSYSSNDSTQNEGLQENEE